MTRESLENFERRIASILRDRFRIRHQMTEPEREIFHEYIRDVRARVIDDIRATAAPLLPTRDEFIVNHTITDDEWTVLTRLGYDRDLETHAKWHGYHRLSDFLGDLDTRYRSGMLARARGAIPKRWRDRLATVRHDT